MQVRSYLKLSIAVALATIALKTGAWWVTDSVSLLSDALESLVNLAGAMFALTMVTVADQPPDADHPYGHHKAEYFSSGFEGVLIMVAALLYDLTYKLVVVTLPLLDYMPYALMLAAFFLDVVMVTFLNLFSYMFVETSALLMFL